MRWLLFAIVVGLLAFMPLSCKQQGLRVGSKKFTESVLLGEMITQLATNAETPAIHFQELGGTQLIYKALLTGEIDIYPDYTGTLRKEVFADEPLSDNQELRDHLRSLGLDMSEPLGFNNTYALGMRRQRADELGIDSISDLLRHPELTLGFSSEFMQRSDGWPNLKSDYGLPHKNVVGLDHDIAYRQLKTGDLDVIDVYTTDAKIAVYDIKVLEDDRQYFPRYDAVLVFRQDAQRRYPRAFESVLRIEGGIDETTMRGLSEQSEIDRMPESSLIATWLSDTYDVKSSVKQETLADRLLETTLGHLDLVRRSLLPAILVGIPLGIVAARMPRLGQGILATAGIIQTIPALALLVLLIPAVNQVGLGTIGAGSTTAVLALFLYGLLPIIRGTHTGLTEVDPHLREAAESLGLPAWFRLTKISLPLASRNILAGIKTATVINIGFATLGALIGAEGYGQPILTGIRLDRIDLILEGALPAAGMAVAAQFLFELSERWLVPRGLLLRTGSQSH